MTNRTIKSKLIAMFVAAGISAPSAFVAYDLTLPSEGLVTNVYLDPVGLPTACVGRMNRDFNLGETFTIDECMEMFAEDWDTHQKQLDSFVHTPYKSEWQKAALTDFTFNVGIGSVRSSTLLRLINQGRHEQACQQLTRWVYAGGSVLRGLVIRRNKTMPYCMGELDWDKQKSYQDFLVEYNEIKGREKAENSN